ncbi:MAG TPA: hypothetical protein VFD32_01690 [Dehalococcoidia bacterium]|nr:hypothetical protein [Dehalococcoidia bacterium]
MATRTKTTPRAQSQELTIDDVAVFALPEREALTTCGGSLINIDIDVRVDLRLGGGDCHRCCW